VSPVTHALMGWLVAAAPRGLSRRDRALITAAAVVPDLDGLGALVEIATLDSRNPLLWFTEYHHALHTALVAAVFAGLAFTFARRRWLTACLALLSFHVHLLCDVVGARGPDGYSWPVPYLSPFSSSWRLEWSGQWALNAWPNFLITGIVLFLTFLLAWDRGYSPVGLFSERADRAFVETLRRRFPKREGGTGMAWFTAANVKRVAAVLLFVALFLPLSRCARQAPVPPGGEPQANAPVTYEYSYAWTRFDAGNAGSYLAILSFLWPLPILLWEAFSKRRTALVVLLWLQPLLCLGSAWLIYMRTLLEQPWTGAWLAWTALSAYFLASVCALVSDVRAALKRRGEAAPAP
jgi:inner membrane protein